MPPRESGPRPVSLLSAIRAGLVGVDSSNDRHPRQQPIQRRLALVELNPNRDALNHLGKIAGRVVGRQQRELRAAGGRYSFDAAAPSLARETVDGNLDRLARLDMCELSFLV